MRPWRCRAAAANAGPTNFAIRRSRSSPILTYNRVRSGRLLPRALSGSSFGPAPIRPGSAAREAQLALGEEGGHLQPRGEIGGFAIARLGRAEVRGREACVDIAEQATRPGLMALFLVRSRELQGLARHGQSAVGLSGREEPLSQVRRPERQVGLHPEPLREAHALLEVRQPLRDLTEAHEGVAEDG